MSDEKTTVLLIEDNPGDARLIREYISESGSDIFKLEHVERLSYGLKFLDECNIGIILLDLTLPDSQGLEGLLKILAKAPDVPVVVLSGIKDEMVAIEAVHAGAQDYLVKGSIDANLLVRLLRHAIERHHLRVALQNSESRYRLLADNIADVVWVADAKGWITYVSPSIERLLGYTVEEVEKLRIRDLLTADSAEQARRLIRNQMEVGVQQSRSSPLSLTLEHVRKDGSTVWSEVMLSFLLDKKGNLAGILGSTRDITARKIAEEALQRSEEHLRSLIENASDAILIINGDGVLQYESPSIERLLGYRFEERVGKSVFENIHPDDRKNVIDVFVQLVQEVGKITQMEMRVRHKNGSWRIIDVTAKNLLDNPAVDGIVANFRDITERKKAEEALRESETRFRTVFEGTSVAIALVDRRGKTLGINPAFSRMFGYGFEEFCSLNKLTYLYPEDAMVDAGLYLELINGKRDHYTIDKRYVRKSGEVLWGRQNLSTVRDAEGKPEYFIAMVEDITEQKRMEGEVRRLSDAVKMSTDSIFVADLEGRIIDANEAALKMFGATCVHDLVGKGVMELIASEDHEKAFENVKKALEEKLVKPVEYHMVKNDGSMIIADISASALMGEGGEPTGFVAVARDITERKKMEQEVHRLSDAVKMSTDSIVLTDLQGTVVEANEGALKMQGVKSRDELIGVRPFDTIVPEDRERAFADLAAIMEKGHVNEVRYRIMTRDGRRIFLETSASLTRDRNGVPTGIVAVSRDITERNRMEKALLESEERFRRLVNNAQDIVFRWSIGKGLEYVSPVVLSITGYSAEELTSNPTVGMELARQGDPVITADYHKVITGGLSMRSRELSFIRKDGKRIYLDMLSQSIRDSEEKVIAFEGILRDITERKIMERELQQREQDYMMLLESTQEGMFVVDAETLKVVYGNRRASMMFGFDPELQDGIGVNILDLVHPEDREIAIKGFLEDLPKLERRKRYEIRASTKDGREIFVSALATRIEFRGKLAVLLSAKDVTERKKTEEALRLSERDYKVLFESTLDGLVVLDAETMKIVLANQTAARLSGVGSADDLIGLDPFQFIPVENRDTVRNIVREDVFEKDLHQIHEYRLLPTDGKEKWVSAVSTRTEYRGRKAALISIRDITERKKAEEEKQKMEEQLRLAGRLASVGELAAGVAHELNNPITAMQGFAQLLTARKDLDESVKKDLGIIYREAQRAGKITKNLLSFARRHEPEKRFISINEALEKTLELRVHQMKINNIELEVELDPDSPRTMADFHQMQQIFVNIINNAEQAMLDAHGKGKLVVRTRRYGDMIQIVFTDDGPGIAEENLKRIFDPFFTTKGVGKGTGLGLSICYGLVEAHNGRIYARSKLGEGATFVVEIPVVPEEVPAAEAVFIKTKRGSARWRK